MTVQAPLPYIPMRMSEHVLRILSGNPGPFTHHGTCSYLLGDERCVVIDPGPDDDQQLNAILSAINGRPLDAILITHCHRDHSPLARALAAKTGAPILAQGPYKAARALHPGEKAYLDGSIDHAHQPDKHLADGDVLQLGSFEVTVEATPGHTMDHLSFHVPALRLCFSGDHVMGWSTSIVAPPDGAMGAYMASLQQSLSRCEDIDTLLPGHGEPVQNPVPYIRSMLGHRRMREASIRERLAAGDETALAIVEKIYAGLSPKLKGAACLSVLAHLEDLIERGLARIVEGAGVSARFAPAHV
jgi:glyoxylase-like metal-dependent hydrolase (beta-lactamase superfamily II)